MALDVHNEMLAVCSLLSLPVLVHFIYVLIKDPEGLRLGLVGPMPQTFKAWLYLGVVTASWLAFVFAGAYTLLSWAPSEPQFVFAMSLSLLSLKLLAYLERFAGIFQSYQKTHIIRHGLGRLVQGSTYSTAGLLAEFKSKAQEAETRVEQTAYAELVRLAGELLQRDTVLVEQALAKAKDQESQKTQQETKAQQSAALQAAHVVRVASLKAVVQTWGAGTPVGKTLVGLNPAEEVRLEPAIAAQKWAVLEDFAKKLAQQGVSANLPELLTRVPGVRLNELFTLGVTLKGNERDGCLHVFSLLNGEKSDIFEGLLFEPSLDGLVAAFFIAAALPTYLAWGHGFVGRDQELLFNETHVLEVLENDRVQSDSSTLQQISVPLGLRYACKSEKRSTMSCMAYLPGKGLYDFAIEVDEGTAFPLKQIELYRWGQGVYY